MADDEIGGNPKTGKGTDDNSSAEMNLLQALKELLLTQKTTAVSVLVEMPISNINVKFDGTNYMLWLSMMETHLAGKGKLGYVRGDKPAPPVNDAGYEQWKMHGYMGKKVEGGCTHCHNPKHTRDTYFKLHGYPEWWLELKKKKAAANKTGGSAQAHQASGTDHETCATSRVSLTLAQTSEGMGNGSELQGKALYNTLVNKELGDWVIDSGATDHMTYLGRDMSEIRPTEKREILNANGISSPVTGMGDIQLTQTLCLKNTLLVPSLSTKLISVGQLAEDLNCGVTRYEPIPKASII